MPAKGRHWVMLWLVLFLVVAVIVTARQTSAIGIGGRLTKVREERSSLEAQRAEIEHRIRELSGRQALGRLAEQSLGLHAPSDSEIVLLRVPTGPDDRP
jgi:cell division protein FtsL